MRRLLAGFTILFVSAVAASENSGQLNKPLVFDFNSNPSIESLNWTFKNRGPVSAEIVKRSKTNQAVRIHSEADKSMAMFTVNIDPSLVHENVTVFKSELHTKNVEQGAHLVVQIKDGDKRIFKEDMRNSPIRGNTGWQSYEITIPKLSNASTVQIGFMVFGAGEVWLDNVSLQAIEPKQSSTDYDGSLLSNQFYQLIAEHYLKASELDLPELERKATGSREVGKERR